MNCSKMLPAWFSVAASLRRRWPGRGAALILLLTTSFYSCAQGLDFQLNTVSIMFEGLPLQQPCFHYDAANLVYITLPGVSWNAVGLPESLTLTSSKLTGAQIRLEKSNSSPDGADFKEKKVVDDYRRRAVATAPQGATVVTVTAEHDMPVDFYHWRNYEFVLDYTFYGQSYRRGTMFLDLDPKAQIVVTYIASPANFDAVRSTALSLLRSWQVQPL